MGATNMTGAASVLDLVKGVKGITTSRTVVTGNAAAVVRLPQGVNAYFRWGNSYREPGITERYLLRDFGDPTFSVLVIPNAALSPERGSAIPGVKVQRKVERFAGYFNDPNDFIGSAFAPPIFVPADPAQESIDFAVLSFSRRALRSGPTLRGRASRVSRPPMNEFPLEPGRVSRHTALLLAEGH
jgi:hypothetical protein